MIQYEKYTIIQARVNDIRRSLLLQIALMATEKSSILEISSMILSTETPSRCGSALNSFLLLSHSKSPQRSNNKTMIYHTVTKTPNVFLTLNPFTAELFFKAWHVSGNLVLQINLTVKYLETIYENVPHALRNSATYHN